MNASVVWAGADMIVWGGVAEAQEGGRYCVAPAGGILADGFESGGATAWSHVVP